MSGSRCKALRKRFKEIYGYSPGGMNITKIDPKAGTIAYEKSVWRRLKKDFNLLRRNG